jgi:WD40 repeat-containing protein SMU1
MRAKLRADLAYQAKDELMLHDCDVICLAWSKDSELLASGDSKGGVKLWQVVSGLNLLSLFCFETIWGR